MRLADLAGDYPITPPGANPELAGITEDSRSILPGMLFVAVPGTVLDGHAYIADAIARGAAAVVAERFEAAPLSVPRVLVPSARRALAEIAARFYGDPARRLSLVGFTGTFGKTSTSEILRSLLEASGTPTAVMGSLGTRFRDMRERSTGLTTPAPVELHGALRKVQDAGASTVIMEVTSHALRLQRVEGLKFGGGLLAAILPGEHTDFHRSYEDYVEAKRLFLRHLTTGATLAYDADNRAARTLAAEARVRRTLGFSIEGHQTDVRLGDVRLDARGTAFTVRGGAAGEHQPARLRSALLGLGHLRNAALALTYALGTGVPMATASDVLGSLVPLRRRMERYDVAGRMVLDDTAAHPESFRATFAVADSFDHRGKIVVVYAIRGNRGSEINAINARSLADLANVHGVDRLIVTASWDVAGQNDLASNAEIDATRQSLQGRGRPFVWHERLDLAIGDAMASTGRGDLIVLIGAQGMDEGKRLLQSSR